jgi:hypothetical protein
MHELMHDDVLEALARLLCEFGIQSDMAARWIAATPLRFHVLDEYMLDIHPDPRLPNFEKRLKAFAKLTPIPGVGDLHKAFL